MKKCIMFFLFITVIIFNISCGSGGSGSDGTSNEPAKWDDAKWDNAKWQ